MASKNGLPAIHPGEYLKELLTECGISQNAFALSVGVSAMRISHVIHGKRPITAELAVLFGKSFGQTPQYWLNLQTSYDLKITVKAMARRIRLVQPISLAA